MFSGHFNNNNSLLIPLTICLAAAAFFIGSAYLVHAVTQAPIPILTRDPAATFDAPPYVGMLSNATMLVWTAAATICLFAAGATRSDQAVRRFLFFAGLFTAVLLLDDLYMIHEVLAPEYLGIPEKVVYVIYAMAAFFWLSKYRNVIRATDYRLLMLALFFLGSSVGIDILDSRGWFPIDSPYLLEDGAKIAGVIFWLAYFTRTAKDAADI
jgi:hypothetical protein